MVAAAARRVNRRRLILVLFAVFAAVLGVLVNRLPRINEDAAFPLSALAARDVHTIRIKRAGSAPAVLERSGTSWRITAPFEAPAEPFQVTRILTMLSARSPQRMPAAALDRFDLADPPLTLTFDAQTFHFGMVNPVTREQYVHTLGAVYVISPRYAAQVPVDAAAFVRRQLLAPGAVPVRVHLPGFEVARAPAGWTITPPREEVGAAGLARFAADWQRASAARIIAGSGRAPTGAMDITLESGERLIFDVVAREPALVLRPRGTVLDYEFSPADSQRLLAPQAAPPR